MWPNLGKAWNQIVDTYEGSVLPFEAWTKAGLPVATSGTITPAELHQQMQNGSAPIIVDVRMPYEWMALRIGTVVNLPINHLAELAGKLDPNLPVLAVCNSAYFGAWGKDPLRYYLVFMFVGTLLGGLVSAIMGRRVQPQLERGPGASRARSTGHSLWMCPPTTP